jgi:outer membrane protein OmpA-like peptidoglycan-associated protein
VKQGYLLPVRTNLSHSESKEGVPMTGLSAQAYDDHVPVGVGFEFSRSLPVRKGEKYYLVIDNVNPKGQGHSIKIYYLKEITVGGVVINENKKPVPNATIWVEDINEKIISVTRSDEAGRYNLTAKIKDDEFYSLIYTSDSSFIESRQIILKEFARTGYSQKDLKTVLPKLERGKKYILDGISYNGNTGRLLQGSYPTLNALARLLMKYKGLQIQIEGHVNNPKVAANTGEDNLLGMKKATEIYDYLLYKGIANTRIVPVSFGSLFMIYPKPSTPAEIEANNRIEIFFLPK